MSNSGRILCLVATLCFSLTLASAQTQVAPCPGYTPGRNGNLACEIATSIQSGGEGKTTSLDSFSPTLAASLSQLPTATAVSGSGLTVLSNLGLTTGSTESLGTILTQRGDTLGRNKWYISLTYQRFDFSSIDGFSLKHIPIVDAELSSGVALQENIDRTRIDLRVDQFAAVGSYGLTNHLDLTVVVPFSQVTLKTGTQPSAVATGGFDPTLTPVQPGTDLTFLGGSASGPGDISAGLKANVLNGEHAKIAVGAEMRFPTGDESNYLGSGAYGLKPYFVFSRTGKVTPNINLAYQWNGNSILATNSATGALQNLPASFLYSGGVDYRVRDWPLTVNAEFLGQAVINGPRLVAISTPLPQGLSGSNPSVVTELGTYAMDNLGVGFKYSFYRGWLLSANTMFALDEGGLRSKIVPLVGISYKFGH